jgi:23S rRNA (cytidine1920-2'-O)/16S rRNA (cytidine1409-2'-O)-methyltransferase
LASQVLVDGRFITNPRALVRKSASITVLKTKELRGQVKLRAALQALEVDVAGRIALDVGAAAGGFTRALLEGGAARVYAIDVGHGQLLGSLRQDRRVINLEGTNVAVLNGRVVPDAIGVVTVDVSYLALSDAVSQLGSLRFAENVDLIGLVKPMFELRMGVAPTDDETVDEAIRSAAAGITKEGWEVVRAIHSPVRGSGGAKEGFIHARRRANS